MYVCVLSDIYLAPKRSVRYFVPDIIRSDRRALWTAAIKIQTVYRCWIESREFFFKRRMVLLIQSIVRMFPKYRKYRRLKRETIKAQAWARRTVKVTQYRRLRRATIVCQRYVRRYEAWMLKWRILRRTWLAGEEPLGAVILLQCRWRITLSLKKTHAKRLHIAVRLYSALVIQRNYFIYKGAFHTFFLTCALRCREEEDLAVVRKESLFGRHVTSARIQQFYQRRYFKRYVSAVVKVQCWYRGRQGYDIVDILRRERWAGRKIRSWVRVRVGRRSTRARRIQHWWWGNKPGRLRRHLWGLNVIADQRYNQKRSDSRHFASMRIQAYVKGVWDRRWVRQLRAARTIVRNARFFFGLKRWRRWKREKVLRVVRKYIERTVLRGVQQRTAQLCALHSVLVRRPQALVRGFIVRCIMLRARKYAYTLSLAVVRIQRHWRARGSMQTALETNCRTPHDTLLLARRSSARYYSSQDPRVGLRVSSLLFRMGCLELLDMFPRKRYAHAEDLSGMTLPRLRDLYSTWQDRVERAQQGKNKSQKGKRRNFPHALFEALVEVVAPPPMPRDPRVVLKLRVLKSLPEYEAPNRFNNYKIVGAVITAPQIERALARCEDSNTVNEALGELLGRGGGGDGGGGAGAGGGGRDKSASAEERRWDSERMSSCASTMQLTVDRLLVLLPPGYLRRVQFTRRLLTEQRKTGKSVDYTDEYADPSDTHKEAHSTGAGGQGHGLAEVVQGVGAAGVAGEGHGRGPLDITDPTVLSTVLPIQRSLDIPYLADLEALELEESVSVCRLYCQVVEQIADLSLAVQSIKNAWANKSMRRAMVQEKLRMFKDEQRAQYTSERQTDKVKVVWEKYKRRAVSTQRYLLIMKAVSARKAGILFELSK
ncbi:hypothetical protein B484DRAFT_396412, partial [Ochromonadaceae sp. CCMP2298]